MIRHVAFEIPGDLVERCAAFYELVGFRRVTPPGLLGDRAVWLERDGTEIHLMYADRAAPARTGHVALQVPDFATTVEALLAAGFDPESRTEYWGSPRCLVRDPADNLIELMQFPPAYESTD